MFGALRGSGDIRLDAPDEAAWFVISNYALSLGIRGSLILYDTRSRLFVLIAKSACLVASVTSY